MMDLPLVPLLLAVGLAGHGLRKKSLSPSGALAAFIVGFLMMSAWVRAFGTLLIVFYLVGSRATKVGKGKKETLEEGHQEAGYRTAQQVLCNSFSAFLATVLWTGLFVPHSYVSNFLPEKLVAQGESHSPDAWCPMDTYRGNGWSRFLILIALGHFACCLGDTLASELGILAESSPLLITTFKRVPPGTNGGISALGTIASAAGGTIMGLTLAFSLLLESSACRNSLLLLPLMSKLVFVGAAAGLFGSFIDSLMGATIQRTRYSAATKRILQDDAAVPPSSSDEIKVISGLNLLTNNQVNLASSIITALATAYFA